MGGGRDLTKDVMSSLSVSTSSEPCRDLSASLMVRFHSKFLSEYNIYISTV